MKHAALAILILILASLACLGTVTPTPKTDPAPTEKAMLTEDPAGAVFWPATPETPSPEIDGNATESDTAGAIAIYAETPGPIKPKPCLVGRCP